MRFHAFGQDINDGLAFFLSFRDAQLFGVYERLNWPRRTLSSTLSRIFAMIPSSRTAFNDGWQALYGGGGGALSPASAMVGVGF